MSQNTGPGGDRPAPIPVPPPPPLSASTTTSADTIRSTIGLPPAVGQVPAPPTKQRRVAPIVAPLVVGLVAGLGIGRAIGPDASDQLNELAVQLCDSLAGEIRMIGGGMVAFAVDQAEKLGYSGPELGNRMQARCPALYSDVVNG